MSNVIFRRIGGRIVPLMTKKNVGIAGGAAAGVAAAKHLSKQPSGGQVRIANEPVRVVQVKPLIKWQTWLGAGAATAAAGAGIMYGAKMGTDVRKLGKTAGYAKINARHVRLGKKAGKNIQAGAKNLTKAAKSLARNPKRLGLGLLVGGAAAAGVGVRKFIRQSDLEE